MKKILCVIGTRPEAIKMAPVIKEIRKHPEHFHALVCITGQHRTMLDQVLDLYAIKADFDLNIMKHNQNLSHLTGSLLSGLDGILEQVDPDWVLAQGDTTSVLAASLSAFYRKIPFGHVEAGLRSYNKLKPFP